MRALILLVLLGLGAGAAAGEFRSIADNGAIMYDAPSLKSRKVYVASRYYPVEIMVNLDNWVKVRDQSGELAWVEKKALSERRTVVVTAPLADVRQATSEHSPLVFQARQGVALDVTELSETGWVRVRHADGAAGYVRLNQVWGF